jgi:hypothetical protein
VKRRKKEREKGRERERERYLGFGSFFHTLKKNDTLEGGHFLRACFLRHTFERARGGHTHAAASAKKEEEEEDSLSLSSRRPR